MDVIFLRTHIGSVGEEFGNGDYIGTVDMSTFSFYFGHQLSTIEKVDL